MEWVKCETSGTTDIPGASRPQIHAHLARTIFVWAPAALFVGLGKIRDFGLKSSWGEVGRGIRLFERRRVSLAPAVPQHSPRVSCTLCTIPTGFLFPYTIPRRMHFACGGSTWYLSSSVCPCVNGTVYVMYAHFEAKIEWFVSRIPGVRFCDGVRIVLRNFSCVVYCVCV